MSDKQRADHLQAKYWNGFITRTEAQKVFEETAQVINGQGQALQKMDAVVSFLAEKLGVTVADIEAWIATKVAAAEQAVPKEPVEEPKLIIEA
jgi:hypothetical protein